MPTKFAEPLGKIQLRNQVRSYLLRMMPSRKTREGLAFATLTLLLAFACGVMMRESAWSNGAPGIDAIPEPGDSAAGLSMMLLYTIQAAIATTALFQRRISLTVLAIVALLLSPTVLIYEHMVSTIGFGAPAVQVDEFARVILAGLSAALLLAPWIVRRLRWPARSPGHLAIAIAVLSGAVLQVVFHFVLVIPGSEISFADFDRTRSVIERTAGPQEIERLVDIGALPLLPLPQEDEAKALAAAHVVAIPSVIRSLEDIRAERPSALHVWKVPGQSKIDRMALVYDGRGDGAPRSWLLPASAFLEPRLTAISAYYFLSGLSGFVWMLGALLVHWGHSRRARAS
jgi:hypothetical protein